MESNKNDKEKVLPFLYLGIGFKEDYDNEFSNIIRKSIDIFFEKYPKDKEKFIGINCLCNDIKNGEMEKQTKLLEEEARIRKENKNKKNKKKKFENKQEEKNQINNKKLNKDNTNDENINIKKNQNKTQLKNIEKSPEKRAYNNFIQAIINKIMSYEYEEKKIKNNLKNNNNLNEVEQNIKNKEKESIKIYKLPKNFHITTLFRGKKGFDKEEEAYKEFEENKETLINVYGIVIIPLKIITFIIKTNEKSINKIPHITAAINGEFKAKNSNDVMENIFGEGKEYHNVYCKLMKGEKFDLTVKGNAFILGKNEEFYFNIFKEPYQIKGNLKGFKG